jgi:hypothetical protein
MGYRKFHRRQTRAKTHSCKIGTIPSLVIFRYKYKIEPGKTILVRDYHHGMKWFKVIIDGVNEDGYFFASRY